MKKITLLTLAFSGFLCTLHGNEQENFQARDFEKAALSYVNTPGAAVFNPPEGWRVADSDSLGSSVQIMVVGEGNNELPPSISLGTENFNGTLREYLQIVKSVNDFHDSEWKELGTITTQAGQASLSQVDYKSEWGELRLMHVIMVRESKAYILTAAALKDEFPKFYKQFFNSMRSLRFNTTVNKETAGVEGKPANFSLNQ